MGVDAASSVSSLAGGVTISIGGGGPTLRPMMWMFLAILATFLVTRTVTRLIRSGRGAGAGLSNVQIAGNHVHHQVFGILVHRKHDHFANIAFVRQQHDDAIDAGRDSTVRRRSIF